MAQRIQWNFLTPYLTPLSRPLERGVQGALQHSRFNRSFGESKRMYDEGASKREAELEKMLMNNARQKQLQQISNRIVYGASGEPLDRPADVDRLLQSEIARSYFNIPQRQFRGLTTTDKTGRPVQRFVDPSRQGSYPVYQKPVPVPTVQGGKPGILYDRPQQGSFYEQPSSQAPPRFQTVQEGDQTVTYQYDGTGWVKIATAPRWSPSQQSDTRTQYTPQQLIDDTRSHYSQLLKMRSQGMLDPITGIPLPEFRDKYNAIVQELEQAYIDDVTRISRQEKPMWFGGKAENPEAAKDQQFLEALKDIFPK